jgi:hypothetical protein
MLQTAKTLRTPGKKIRQEYLGDIPGNLARSVTWRLEKYPV